MSKWWECYCGAKICSAPSWRQTMSEPMRAVIPCEHWWDPDGNAHLDPTDSHSVVDPDGHLADRCPGGKLVRLRLLEECCTWCGSDCEDHSVMVYEIVEADDE